MVDTNLYNTLKERGLLYQCTDEEALKKMLESGTPVTLYEGTDPTADSLHIGHCVPYCILRRFQKAGHKVILLMGGATAQIGDPTGESEIRKQQHNSQINKTTTHANEVQLQIPRSHACRNLHVGKRVRTGSACDGYRYR